MVEVKIPIVGEGFNKYFIGQWHVQNGESVSRDQVICEVETDKATFEVLAPNAGVIKIQSEAGSIASNETVIAVLN